MKQGGLYRLLLREPDDIKLIFEAYDFLFVLCVT